ncbi:HIT family protein [Candidatus Woesebacteria bacterium]|nr:HIT family protein [Candidatus Woesebacteria bacterium]
MKINTPKNYICPICLGNQGIESDDTLLKQADLVFRDDLVSVWINSFWIKGNEGHVIIVPNEHFENIYSAPSQVGHRLFEISKLMSIAIKEAYHCDGITLRQNNEPAGDQHALHYHMHVFPRYEGDAFNQELTKKKLFVGTGCENEVRRQNKKTI